MARASYKLKIEKNSSVHSDNRLLLLDITDGTMDIKAIEYKRIDVLSSQMESGTKVKYNTHC